MKFTSINELYNFLIPVFNVKDRINKYYGYNIEYEDIWSYLVYSKWKMATDLCLSEMVNDIINLDNYKMKRMMSNEKR